MTFIDFVQIVSLIMSIVALGVWLIWLHRWPLTAAVVISMLVNAGFYVARTFDLLRPDELNLFSALRVLLLVCVIAAVPFSIERKV